MTAIDVPAAAHSARSAPDELLESAVWSDAHLAALDVPVLDSQLVSIGGGLGTFALVDELRVAGVGPERVRVLGPTAWPQEVFRYLCSVSGLSPDQPLPSARSDLWWRMVGLPLLSGRARPTSGEVTAGLLRAAERLGWSEVRVPGSVRVVRRRLGGGYFSLLESSTGVVAYRSEYVHLALGYAGLAFLPELCEFRAEYGDSHRFVHAYEPHDHLFRALAERPCTVLVLGVDSAAARLLRRVVDEREQFGAQTRVIQLCSEDEQVQGQRWLEPGRRDGWYAPMHGRVFEVVPDVDGRLLARGVDPAGGRLKLGADFVVDASGLDRDVRGHGLLADLVGVSGAELRPDGSLVVDPAYELGGVRNGSGRVFGSGPIVGDDSFTGLRKAASTIRTELARDGFCDRIGPLRSLVRRVWRSR